MQEMSRSQFQNPPQASSNLLPTAKQIATWQPIDVKRFLETISKGERWSSLAKFAEERPINGLELLANAGSPDDLLDLFADAHPKPDRATMRTVIAVLHTYSVAPHSAEPEQAMSLPRSHNSHHHQQQLSQQVVGGDDTGLFLDNSLDLMDDDFLDVDDNEAYSIGSGSGFPSPAGSPRNAAGDSSTRQSNTPTGATNLALLADLDRSNDHTVILTCMRSNLGSAEVQKHGSLALSRLLCKHEGLKDAVGNFGAVEDLLRALETHRDNTDVVEAVCAALAALVCDHDANQRKVVLARGIELMLRILMASTDTSRASVAEASCRALVQCTYDNADAQGAAAAANGFRIMLGTVSRHAKRPRVVEAACHVLGNMLMDNRVNQAAALSAAAAGPNSNTCCPTLMCNLVGVLGDHGANSRVAEIVCATLVILLQADATHGTRGVVGALIGAGGIDALLYILRGKHAPGNAGEDDDGDCPDGACFNSSSKRARKNAADGCEDACAQYGGDIDPFSSAAVVISACTAFKMLAQERSAVRVILSAGAVPVLVDVAKRFSQSGDVVEVGARVCVCVAHRRRILC